MLIFGLTPLGVFHTAISLVAVFAGLISFIRYKEISPVNLVGKIYVITTVITCLTGFGIFQHGGFGNAHVLGIITLVVLGIAGLAGKTKLFGRASSKVEMISYSTTFFFHMIPTITEVTTRLPYGAPLFKSQDAPALQAAIGVSFVLFLILTTLQVRYMQVRINLMAVGQHLR
jgi:uncharacterized membrane protein